MVDVQTLCRPGRLGRPAVLPLLLPPRVGGLPPRTLGAFPLLATARKDVVSVASVFWPELKMNRGVTLVTCHSGRRGSLSERPLSSPKYGIAEPDLATPIAGTVHV